MGLTVSLSNALSGMTVGQKALDILSRNVANAGTPGYHRQSLSVVDRFGTSPYAQAGTLTRAFSASLQAHYTREVSDSGYADAVASLLDRLQTAFGLPGEPGSLDTVFNEFETGLSALATSPDNFATRTEVIAGAQALASTLNRLSQDVQSLRSDADAEIGNGVASLNASLSSLHSINRRLADESADPSARASLMDQRDRLIADVAGLIDVNVDYRANGTVGLMTRSGIGILDAGGVAVFGYAGGGQISANSLFDPDPAKSGVGALTLTSPSGLRANLVSENILQSGGLKAMIDLRDQMLVRAQGQLDDVAAALSQAMSTVETMGTPATSGAASGFEVDVSGIRPGNDLVIDYTAGGQPRQLRVVRVEDGSQLPMDYVDANGARVIGLSFAGGAGAVASALNGILSPGLAFSNPSGSTLRVLDDGATNSTGVTAVTARATVAGTQGNGLGLSLFVDTGNADFTDAITGTPQRRGFAARITINATVRVDNRLLVQYQSGGSLGDSARADYLRDRLGTARFASQGQAGGDGMFRLSGTASEMITQTLNYQGNAAAAAESNKEGRDLTMEAITQRFDEEYGVDVDEEMARLMELQNAFAANARVVAAVQDLINALLDI